MEQYMFADDYVNPRGIPRVEYIADMATCVKNGGGANTVVSNLIFEHSKYEHMEKRLVSSLANLDYKIPTIKKTLHALNFLKERLGQEGSEQQEGGVRTFYSLTDSVFGEAVVAPQKTVHLWMGAKVMVEYTFEEATQLLEKNLINAEKNVQNTKEDLAWVQEQITNLQINMSRVYNHDIKNRKSSEGAKKGTNGQQSEKEE